MQLSPRIRQLNSHMIYAATNHVGKSEPGKKIKPWSTPALQDAIKLRYTLRRTVQSNREEYLVACGELRRLSEEAQRTKWEKLATPTQPEFGTRSNPSWALPIQQTNNT